MRTAVRVEELVAGYGGVPAVRGLDLHVDAGEVVALLGPNGAGKTTTLLTIAGVLPPIAGTVQVLGQPGGGPPHVLASRGLALVPEDRGLLFQLSVRDNLRLRARGRGAGDRIAEVLELFPALVPLLRRKTALLSGGEQQMLALAGAIGAAPGALLIDELSLGLAPVIVAQLLPIVRTIARERDVGVLLVEQHTNAALAVADRAYVIAQGMLVLHDEASALRGDPARLESAYLDVSPGGER